jgi:Family of unknown function (DUF6365)
MSLAREISGAGGSVWFFASPNAASIARREYPAQTFEMTNNRERNRVILLRMLKKIRPEILVFSEFYEIIRPRRRPDCPLIDATLIEALDEVDCIFAFVDFIAHAPILREIGQCDACSDQFGGPLLRRFLRRLFVMVPCPLNDPGQAEEQQGIPYRSLELPRTIRRKARAELRSRFLGGESGYLVLRTGATWQSKLADKQGVTLYRHLGALLGYYLSGLRRPVTLVSVSSAHELGSPTGMAGFRICNVKNLPPDEFEQLILASDLVLTDNEIAYTLGTTIGRVPGVILNNTYDGQFLLDTLEDGPVRSIVSAMEDEQPGSIYPYQIFPIPADRSTFTTNRKDKDLASSKFIRLGRMQSSPFSRAEIFGGEETRCLLRQILCDNRCRELLRKQDIDYICRLTNIQNGLMVLNNLMKQNTIRRFCVL